MKKIILATVFTLLSVQTFAASKKLVCTTEGQFAYFISGVLKADIISENELANVTLVALRHSAYTKSGVEIEDIGEQESIKIRNGKTENINDGWGDAILKFSGSLNQRNLTASLYYTEVDGDYFYENTSKMVCEVTK